MEPVKKFGKCRNLGNEGKLAVKKLILESTGFLSGTLLTGC